ncbi:hypothetical protein Tco_0400745 [Tanacetum coccineum]
MIDLSKKKRTTDQFNLVRRDQVPHDSTTGPSSQPEDDTSEKVVHESSSTTDSERTESGTEVDAPKGDKEQGEVASSTVTSGVGISVRTEDQAGSDPGKAHEALAGPDPEPMQEDQTGSDSGKVHVSLAGPNPEHMDEEFLATAYPKVHENLKLITDERVIEDNPESHSGSMSSMKNLEDTDNFGDQFLYDKPTEDDQEKSKVVNESDSTIPDPSHQTVTTTLPEITPFIALQLRVAKLEQDMSEYLGTKLDDALLRILERHTADLIEKYSVLPGPESIKNQESKKSPKEIIRIKREQGEKKQESTYTIRSTDKVALEEFDLKNALFKHMHKNRTANRNPANFHLYHALMEALIADEDAMDKEVKDRVKDHKRKHDSDDDEDDDDDEGPSAGSNQGKSTKRRRHDSGASGSAQPPPKDDEQSSKKPQDSDASASKQHPTLTSTGWQITDTRDAVIDSSMHRSEPESGHSEHSSDDVSKQDEGHVSDLEDTDNAHIPKVTAATWFKPIPEDDQLHLNQNGPFLQMITLNQRTTGQMYTPQRKKKLCKADLEGPTFNLVKAFHNNSVSLQFQMDECHKLLTDKVDLVNPEGHQILRNVYEPLPLGGPPGQVESERDYDISAAYGITHWWFRRKEFYINKHREPSDRDAVRSHMRILSVISIKTYERYGYYYLREIVLRRADYKEYKILEKDFKNLHPNDFEDMFLLHLQDKLNHLPKSDKVNLHTALNLEQPNWDASDFLFKEDYTIVNKSRVVIYRDRDDNKKMMRIDEVHKFSDGTLMRIRDKLDFMVKDFRLVPNFNKGLETEMERGRQRRRSKGFIEVTCAILQESAGDDPIACLNKAMAFLTAVASSRGDKVKVILVLVIRVVLLVLRETMQVDRQGLLNATTVKEKTMLVEAQEAGQILDEEQLAFLADLGVPDGKAVQTIIPNNVAFQTEDLDTYDF